MKADADHGGGHLDGLVLDALRAGEGTPEQAAHAADCPRCRAGLDSLTALETRLRETRVRTPEVPRAIEARIFQRYRQSLGKPAPLSFLVLVRRWSIPVAGLAAAGVAALALRLAPPEAQRMASPLVSSREAGEVLQPDRSDAGKPRMAPNSRPVPALTAGLDAPPTAAAVDIVDAFRLARALRDGQPVAAGWDVDGDGVVGGADVQALARRAVAL